MRIFVTGGTGFIGSHSVVALQRAGHDVRLLVRNTDKMHRVFEPHDVAIADYVVGDVCDAGLVREAMSGCDAVIHSAGMVATSKKMADQVRKTNVDGTENIVGQAVDLGINKVIHVSSITALHNPSFKEVHENSPVGKADNPYGRSKVECEFYVRGMQAAGAPVTITYPAGVIGPLDPGLTEPLEGLRLLLRLFVMGAGGDVQFIDVRDCADIHLKIIEASTVSGRYLLGGPKLSWQELGIMLESITGRKLLHLSIPPQLLRACGSLLDFVHVLTDINMPLSHEGAVYATQWCYSPDKAVRRDFDFDFMDLRQSIIDTLQSMEWAGHLNSRDLGKLSRTREFVASTT